MRQRFQAQLSQGVTPIEAVKIPTKTHSYMAALQAALQYIYPGMEPTYLHIVVLEVVERGEKDGPAGG